MSNFKFGNRSRRNLQGVHQDLVNVVVRALSTSSLDFGITEGLRTIDRQALLVEQGLSTTMNSRHLTGHAVDIVAYDNGTVSWKWGLYDKIKDDFKAAADYYDVDIEWGGEWVSFKDGVHFQLSRKSYP